MGCNLSSFSRCLTLVLLSTLSAPVYAPGKPGYVLAAAGVCVAAGILAGGNDTSHPQPSRPVTSLSHPSSVNGDGGTAGISTGGGVVVGQTMVHAFHRN